MGIKTKVMISIKTDRCSPNIFVKLFDITKQMFTDICSPNISVSRNDWNVRKLRCKNPSRVIDYPKEIGKIIEKEYEVSPFANVEYRSRNFVIARQLLMAMLYKNTTWTTSKIGNIISKDHSTVFHSINAISNLYETDKRFRIIHDRIEQKVKSLK